MLTFFRRIRKGLLGDGETRKYVLYAIGEIALVVIGILIALQINNWNENDKERAFEVMMLNEIRDALQKGYCNLFNVLIERTQVVDYNARQIYRLLDQVSIDMESLNSHITQITGL